MGCASLQGPRGSCFVLRRRGAIGGGKSTWRSGADFSANMRSHAAISLLLRRWPDDRHLDNRRNHFALLPIGERERDLGIALSRRLGDPHGAVEVCASATLLEREFCPGRLHGLSLAGQGN